MILLLVSSSDVNFHLFQRSNTSYERQWTDPSELSTYPQSVRRDLILTWSNENGRIMTLFLSFCFFVLFLFFLTKFSRIPSWKSWIRGKGQPLGPSVIPGHGKRSDSYLEAFSESAFLASLSICCVDQIAIITSQTTNIFCFCQDWTSEESFAAFTRLNFVGFSFCVGVNIARARNKLRLIFDRFSKNTWKRAWIMMSIWFSSTDSTRSTCPLKDILLPLVYD